MARGITESDVHTAANEIVGLGERPTVERVRAHLGTGSSNRARRRIAASRAPSPVRACIRPPPWCQ